MAMLDVMRGALARDLDELSVVGAGVPGVDTSCGLCEWLGTRLECNDGADDTALLPDCFSEGWI